MESDTTYAPSTEAQLLDRIITASSLLTSASIVDHHAATEIVLLLMSLNLQLRPHGLMVTQISDQ